MLENSNRVPKTKQEYSRNVKLLKLKLEKLLHIREDLERKRIANAKRLNNDRVIAMKIGKFCRERKFTPEMLFRFADRKGTGEVDQAEFKSTLMQLGLRLSVDELNKMVLLIDEDLSGKVSIGQYYAYLSAFNMRMEPTKDEPFVVTGLKKLNKLLVEGALGIKLDEFVSEKTKETADEDVGADNRKRRLPRYKYMDYEEFYRFCNKHQPGMKEKELLSIFNRLDPEGTGLVLIDELRVFFKEGQKELERKNARIIGKQESQKKKKNDKEQQKQNLPIKPPANLKGLLQLVLRNRTRHGRFHLLEFKALATNLGNKQEIGELFRAIDEGKQGSFGYNQVLVHYLKKKDPKENYNFAYEIMQLSLEDSQRRIDQVLFTNKLVQGSEMTPKVFADFMREEFTVDEAHAKLMYEELLNEFKVKRLDSSHLAKKFREVAKASKAKDPFHPDLDNIISLNYFGTKANDFLKKGCGTILRNPMVALRFCVQLEQQIQKQNREKWSDFEFGPSPNDAKGMQSLVGLTESTMSLSMPSEKELTWIRATDLGFTEFYSPTDTSYHLGRFENSELLSALVFLSRADKDFLTKQFKQPPPALKELTPNELEPIFTGLYPRVFHYFARYGIYVFRLFVEDCWVYVLIDDLLPCTTKKQPLTSTSVSRKYSWVPLIEKAYAKVKGGYCSIYGQTTLFESLYELSHQVPSEFSLPDKFPDEKTKDDAWKSICRMFPKDAPPKISCFNSTRSGELKVDGININLRGSQPIQLLYAVELGDIRLENYHKSHRLLFLRKPEKYEDSNWNKNWSQELPDSRFFDYNDEIRDEMKKAKNYGLLLPVCLIINYSLFRELYNSVFGLTDLVGWEGRRANDCLDKQKNGGYATQYRLRLSQPTQFVVTIHALENSRPTYELTVENEAGSNIAIDADSESRKWIESTRRLTVHNITNLDRGNHLLLLRSRQPFRYSLSVYFKHTSYKFTRVPNQVDFEPIKQLEKQLYNEQSAGDKAMEYLETRFFKLPARRKTTCCC